MYIWENIYLTTYDSPPGIVWLYSLLAVNAGLDKFGKIEPSTSTVFIGMCLGGTWGFILDNMLGWSNKKS